MLYVKEVVKDKTKEVYEIVKIDEDGQSFILSASSIGYNGTFPPKPELVYPQGNESGYLQIP